MSEKELDALLSRMESIATAVNGFTSETVQQAAFAALVDAFSGSSQRTPASGGPSGPSATSAEASADSKTDDTSTTNNDAGGGKKTARKKAGSGGGKEFKLVKDLDLRPNGKESFDDFIAKKQPKSNEDKYAVATYYLQYILELPAISWHHVATVFRLTSSWRESADVQAGLRSTSNRKGTIDCSDYEKIKVTPHGRNFVEHDLPPKAQAKK